MKVELRLDSNTPHYKSVEPTLKELGADFSEEYPIHLQVFLLDDLLKLVTVLESSNIMARCEIYIIDDTLVIREYEDG